MRLSGRRSPPSCRCSPLSCLSLTCAAYRPLPSPLPLSRTALVLYRQILDAIEANDYNNFTQRAYVPKWRKMVSLPEAFMRATMAAPKAGSMA